MGDELVFRSVLCKQCGKAFKTELTKFVRDGKVIYRHDYWCTKACRVLYYKQINK